MFFFILAEAYYEGRCGQSTLSGKISLKFIDSKCIKA